jgi:hypothetical protein
MAAIWEKQRLLNVGVPNHTLEVISFPFTLAEGGLDEQF